MTPGQAISITINQDADRVELERRMQADGIRIKVVTHKQSRSKISARSPAGTTPALIDTAELQGCLALSRAEGQEIVITIKPGGAPAEAMAAFAQEGVLIGLGESHTAQAAIRIKAPRDLLVLREELLELGETYGTARAKHSKVLNTI
ncbi:hypothetical protein [Pseudomonas sp. TMP25]|uniref:hypothetical protein n=1 Tax=Pseudomonas sp. TMP25 TaxID=3136561 RepID=UPI00310159DD